MGIKQIAINSVLAAIFMFALIMWGVGLANDNNAPQTIANNPSIGNFTQTINSSFNQYPADVSNATQSFSNDIPTAGALGLIFFSVGGLWKTLLTVPYALFTFILSFIYTNVFGGSQFWVIFGVIGALVSAVIILSAWAWIRLGNSND